MAKNNQQTPKRYGKKGRFIGTHVYVDSSTGEQLGERQVYRTQAIKTIFVTMYLNDENVYDLMSGLGNSGKVLAYILKDYNDKTGMFYFSSTAKDLMVKDLKLSIGTIRSSVRDFASKRIIVHMGGSEYAVNPHLFYKGLQTNYDNMVAAFDAYLTAANMKEVNKRIEAKTITI